MSDPPRSAPPVVSVIVPTLGRSPLLQAGLEALRADDGPRRELLLVAPRGVDLGGVEDLADRVLRLGGLPGFTVANNRALEVARGRFVALVNDDAVIQRGWLAALVAALRVRPDVAGVQGVNVRLDGEGKGGPTARIDGWGLGWNRWSQAIQLGHGEPFSAAPQEPREIFGVSATAALYRRSALDALRSVDRSAPPIFDERLGSYYEDVELAIQLAAAGWRSLVVPSARCGHAGSATGSTLPGGGSRPAVHANRLRVLARAFGRGLVPRLPRLLAREALDVVACLRAGDRRAAAAIVRGLRRAVLGARGFLRVGPPIMAPRRLRTPGVGPAGALPPAPQPEPLRAAPAALGLADVGRAGTGSITRSPSIEDPRLSAVVVHWRNEVQLRRLLAAWPLDRAEVEILVVDNGGTLVAEDLPAGVRLLRSRSVPGGNLGFAGGAQLGLDAARAPWVLLLNPDVVPRPHAVDALLDGMAAHPDAAALVPALEDPDGTSQHRWQLQPLPSPCRLLAHLLFFGGEAGPTVPPPPGAAIEQPAAAALLLRRAAIARVGGFDRGFFPAWFEDVDLAYRLRAAGEALRFLPSARFTHDRGGSVPSLGYGRFLWIYERNLVRYLRRHHGGAWARLARGLAVLGAALRMVLVPLRRPRRAAGRLAAVLDLLAVALGAVSGWRLPRSWARRFAAPPAPAMRPTPSALAASAAPEGSEAPPAATGANGSPAVSIVVIAWNTADDLEDCLASVWRQTHRPLELIVVDNASTDGSGELLRRLRNEAPSDLIVTLLELDENRGFAGGMNAALAVDRAPLTLALNADARPEPDFVAQLVARFETSPRVGAVTGRLVRPGTPPRLDACGMHLVRAWRHLDRGSDAIDEGQFARADEVFGGTGAATMYRRAALDDVAFRDGAFAAERLGGGGFGDPPRRALPSDRPEIFAEPFFTWREDAELAFRLQARGWRAVYEPTAVAEHRRFVLPRRRADLPPMVNYHSLKNRYLLRAWHQTPGNFLRTLPWTLPRDVLALGYVVLRERSSLAAYAWLWRHRREIGSRRRWLRRRTTTPGRVETWFRRQSRPLADDRRLDEGD